MEFNIRKLWVEKKNTGLDRPTNVCKYAARISRGFWWCQSIAEVYASPLDGSVSVDVGGRLCI